MAEPAVGPGAPADTVAGLQHEHAEPRTAQLARGNERQKYKYRHTGIIVSAGPTSMATIEGNTNDDGSADGYEVCARTRAYGDMDFIVL